MYTVKCIVQPLKTGTASVSIVQPLKTGTASVSIVQPLKTGTASVSLAHNTAASLVRILTDNPDSPRWQAPVGYLGPSPPLATPLARPPPSRPAPALVRVLLPPQPLRT